MTPTLFLFSILCSCSLVSPLFLVPIFSILYLRFISFSFKQELKREDPTGVGGPSSESYVLDSRAALVERRAVISRERLILGHCLVLSIFVERASKPQKDIICGNYLSLLS